MELIIKISEFILKSFLHIWPYLLITIPMAVIVNLSGAAKQINMAGGLIEMGLNRGAALSFLIAGATTTLPAMVAVWGITKARVFLLYLSFALCGALLAGLCFNLFN